MAEVLPQAVSDYYRARQRLIVATLGLVRREWATMGEDFDASWSTVGPRLTLLTASAQLGAARAGSAYIPAALAQQGQTVKPTAADNPRGLVGIASDGRPLESLLYGAVVHARTAEAASFAERLEFGRRWLDSVVQTQVADAGRDASKVAMAVRPGVKYVRMVNPPCCQRCAALSGERREYSHPFKRHPGCDCSMIPTTVANPDFAGEKLTAADVTDLTQKQKAALEGGANFHSTINDYQRKRGAFSALPPTRIEKLVVKAGARDRAAAALAEIGLVIP